ncbi:hypothetical protein LguiB_005324 [Lonicera macranthoides]
MDTSNESLVQNLKVQAHLLSWDCQYFLCFIVHLTKFRETKSPRKKDNNNVFYSLGKERPHRVSDLTLAPGVPPSRVRPLEISLRGKLIFAGGLLCRLTRGVKKRRTLYENLHYSQLPHRCRLSSVSALYSPMSLLQSPVSLSHQVWLENWAFDETQD